MPSLIERMSLRVGPLLASGLIRTLHALMRWRSMNEQVVVAMHREGRPYVHAFFHDQLLMMTYSYLGKKHGRTLAVLSSRHRDGEFVARTLRRFGHLMVRGSSGRGGVAGLKEMIRHLRASRDAAFATDGPKGPRHRVQIGVIEAARLGHAPIVPVAFAASKKKLSAPGTRSRFPTLSRAESLSTVIRSRSLLTRTAPSWS
jgi:hypothetical protein